MIREYRAAILFAVPLLLVMVAVAALQSEKDKGEGHPSSYSNLRKGAKAAYLLLEQSGYPMERWEHSPRELPQNASDTLLIVADPESLPSGDETNALSHFVLQGGTILAAGFLPDSFVPRAAATYGDLRVGGVECKPVAPTRLTRGGTISLDGPLVWNSTDHSQVLHFADEKGMGVVVSYSVGRGEVIWWASALPLENTGIREKNNLELLLNSVGGYKRILWDEYYHTERSRILSHTRIRASGWALGQLAVIAFAVVLTFSRRSGPLVPLPDQPRLSPVEFVETLGSVFQRADSTQVAVEIAFQRLRQIASRRLGLRGSASSGEIVDAISQRRLRLSESAADLVRRSEEAISDPALSEKAAMAHVRALNEAIQSLDPAITPKEKS